MLLVVIKGKATEENPNYGNPEPSIFAVSTTALPEINLSGIIDPRSAIDFLLVRALVTGLS